MPPSPPASVAPVDLSGRRALVTGAASGIGAAIAERFVAAGAVVVAVDRDKTGLKELAARLGDGSVEPVQADLADLDAIADLPTDVDILVNNAGIQYTAPVREFPIERWDAIIAINLSAAFCAIRTVLPQMESRGWGRIINIASTHGIVASIQKAAYVAAKHGLIGLTKVVALETATTGITCNAICPGWVLTPLVQKQIDDIAAREGLGPEAARAKLLGEKQPSLQFATPEQIGALAAFLCSDAAAQIRGAALPVDGGWTAQ
jgi:3-hydroxybutyrate dehydrogenase